MPRHSEILYQALAKIVRRLYHPAEKDKPNGPGSY